uniref:Putative ovule protein n=1 Tax=Solanum chacoense TaxID=4108 RepID=A0A0V0HFI9_SOLCH
MILWSRVKIPCKLSDSLIIEGSVSTRRQKVCYFLEYLSPLSVILNLRILYPRVPFSSFHIDSNLLPHEREKDSNIHTSGHRQIRPLSKQIFIYF